MNEEIKQAIFQKIREYSRIMLFRHKRMDGDCAGATKGMKALLQASFPEKEILLVDSQHSDFLAFLGPDDGEVSDEVYQSALGIVLDVSEQTRISNQKFRLCREVIKIDHHIPLDNYGVINWVEEDRSAVCEMVADFYNTFRDELILTRQAAMYLYLGLVTDSGRFRFSEVKGETLRLAGMLLDTGFDTETLYAHLYLKEYEGLKFKAHIYEHMRRTENGAAWVFVPLETQRQFGLSTEAAATAISYLENIWGCLCWLAFIEGENPEEGIRVRLRSRFMTINALAERHHGGGHACAAGATVFSRKEMEALIQEADEAVKAYKESHTGWM